MNVQADKLLQEHEQNNPQSGEKLWIRLFLQDFTYLYVIFNAANRLGTADVLHFLSPLHSDRRLRRQLIQRLAAPAPLWRASKAWSALMSRCAKTSNVQQSGAEV